MWKLSMDMAERNGSALRRRLWSADLCNDAAMARGERRLKTPVSRSSASLVLMTRADQRCGLALTGGRLSRLVLRLLLLMAGPLAVSIPTVPRAARWNDRFGEQNGVGVL
jgi:hypothetical protein